MTEPVASTPTLDPHPLFYLLMAFTKEKEDMTGHKPVALRSKKTLFCLVTASLKCFLIGDKQCQVRATEWFIVKPS